MCLMAKIWDPSTFFKLLRVFRIGSTSRRKFYSHNFHLDLYGRVNGSFPHHQTPEYGSLLIKYVHVSVRFGVPSFSSRLTLIQIMILKHRYMWTIINGNIIIVLRESLTNLEKNNKN